MDTVFIQGLHLLARIGVHPHEKQAEQSLWLDIELRGDFSEAARSDDIQHAVDYSAVAEQMRQLVDQRHYQLLEHLGDHMASELFKHQPLVHALSIRLTKPAVVAGADSVGVVIERERQT